VWHGPPLGPEYDRFQRFCYSFLVLVVALRGENSQSEFIILAGNRISAPRADFTDEAAGSDKLHNETREAPTSKWSDYRIRDVHRTDRCVIFSPCAITSLPQKVCVLFSVVRRDSR
jgi:hypothetical protein